MAGSSQLEVRKAIYKALNDDTTLTSTLGASVYHSVPDDAALPYVLIESIQETLFDTFGRDGREMLVSIHSWSEKPDATEPYDIADRIMDLLDFETLDATKLGTWTGIHINLNNTEDIDQVVDSRRYKLIRQVFLVRVHE